MQPPPRDENGLVQPHDHPDIQDTDNLIRRISPHHVVKDANGSKRISTAAIQPSSNNAGMSIDLERLIHEAGLDAKEYVTNPRWLGSIILTAGDVRAEGFQVGFHPVTPPQHNPYHGEVWGKFSKSKQKALLRKAQWFVPIANVSVHA